MADYGKRWEEAPTCGSSLPKVVPGGHQQSTHPQEQSPTAATLLLLMHKEHLLKPNTHPRPHLNSPLLPRSDLSAQTGRNSKSYSSLKSGWTRSRNRLHDQSPFIPPLHHQNSHESFELHQPHHPKDPCHHLSCQF